MTWHWQGDSRVCIFDAHIEEQHRRIDVLTKVIMEVSQELVDGAENKEMLRGLLLALNREKRILKALVSDVDL